jgi:glycosyltransferase involved in cell wall biosynthesis
VPGWWRALEERLRLNLVLAAHARAAGAGYDLIWADSEKVGVPLALMRPRKPVVTVVHHIASRRKRALLRGLGVCRAWAAVGYVSEADRRFLMSYYGLPAERLFHHRHSGFGSIGPLLARPLPPAAEAADGPIVGVGSSQRDYATLFRAIEGLPGVRADVYGASRFGEGAATAAGRVPDGVRILPRVPFPVLAAKVRRARFVALPVRASTQYSAGRTAALEAQALGKAVVATRTAGMPDYVRDGTSGLLVAPGDAEAMRDAIRALWHNPERAERMGRAGRRLVEERYGVPDHDYEAAFGALVAELWRGSRGR